MAADKNTIEKLAKAWLAEARRIKTQVVCDCGCGEVISGKVRFRPGHDAKLLARYRKEIGIILSS
jgi:hypothetical protein